MRNVWISGLLGLSIGCGNAEEKGRLAAQAQLEAARKARQQSVPTPTSHPPVRGGAKIPCAQLLNAEALTRLSQVLLEKAPLGIRDRTENEPEATSACSLVRGGQKPSIAQQTAYEKQHGRLGVLPGDEVCRVSANCGQIHSEASVREWCAKMKFTDEEGLGGYTCKQVVATGEWDIESFRFFDEDTKCVLRVMGGPSIIDNEVIRNCAKTVRSAVTPASIAIP